MTNRDVEQVKIALNLLRTTVTLGLLDLEQSRGRDVSTEIRVLEHTQENEIQKLICMERG